MKITVPGKTPMERLTNLTRGLMTVRKTEIDQAIKNAPRKKRRRKRR